MNAVQQITLLVKDQKKNAPLCALCDTLCVLCGYPSHPPGKNLTAKHAKEMHAKNPLAQVFPTQILKLQT